MILKALQAELFRIKMDSLGMKNPKIPGIQLKHGRYDIYVAVKDIQQDLCYGCHATGAYFITNIRTKSLDFVCIIGRHEPYGTAPYDRRIVNNEWILSMA